MPKKNEKIATEPQTLQEAVVFFEDENNCIDHIVKQRWPNGVTCPRCGSPDVYYLKNQKRWNCRVKHERRQFSVKVGTVMEDSPIPLSKWLPAMWLISNCKNGVSSYELSRALNITQKTAWFVLHRIRMAMHDDDPGKLSGEVEVDETFIGGKARNMHKSKKAAKITGTGGSGKAAVMGLLERGKNGQKSRVQAKVVPNVQRATLQAEVYDRVTPGSEVNTDAWVAYKGLDPDYVHKVIDHAEAYVQGSVTTNRVENFWTLLKRTIKGSYVAVEPFHLHRYVDEQAFRFNERKDTDCQRLMSVIQNTWGKRLTYKKLIGDEGLEPTIAS